MDGVHRDAETESLCNAQEVIRGALAQGLAYPLFVDRSIRPVRAGNLDFVEARQTNLERAQRFLQRFLKRAPDGHHLTNRFH